MRARTPRRLRLVKKLIFALIPTILFLGSAELLIRWTAAHETCPTTNRKQGWICDPLLHFKNDPELVVAGAHLNTDGFRGRAFTPKKPGVFRILSMGDSCTFGIVPADQGFHVRVPYPQYLEGLLAKRFGPNHVEVLNAGSPGYNSFQGLMLLRTKLRGLEPDLITVRFGWNDHFMSAAGRREGAFRESHNPIVRGFKELLVRTALYPFALRLLLEMRARLGHESNGRSKLPTEWVPNLSVKEYKYALGQIAELGRRRGARVWLLTPPIALSSDQEISRYEALPRDALARKALQFNAIVSFRRLREIHDRYVVATREVAAELDVPLVDMEAIYRNANDARLFSLTDMLHPTQRGHILEAETLFRRLIRSDILLELPEQG